MNWFAFLPGLYKDEKVGGDKIGFFVNPEPEGRGLAARRPGHLGRRLLRQHGRGAGLHQVVRPARGAEEVVVARRLFLPQGGAQRPGLPASAALRRRLPERDGQRQGLLGRAVLRRSCCRPCRSASTTMSSPTRAPRRKRSTGWSRTGPRSSRTTARSKPASSRACSRDRARMARRAERIDPADAAQRRTALMTDTATASDRMAERCRRATPAPIWRGGCAACPTGPSPGSSSRRRSCCCSRSTSSR